VNLIQAGGIAGDADDVSAGPGKGFGDAAAEASTCTGDYRCPSG